MKFANICRYLLAVAVFAVVGVSCQNERRFSEKEVLDMLLEGYDTKLRPGLNSTGESQPVHVRVNMLIRSITRVDDIAMAYDAQITLRTEWNDPRLAYDAPHLAHLNLPDPDRIWKPDLFFQNERSAYFHMVPTPNVMTRITPNGDVMNSVRLTVTFGCPMDLRMFPMDRQVCEIRMASYGFTSRDVIVEWKTGAASDFQPIQLAADLTMARFRLVDRKASTCTSHTTSGTYSCIKAGLFLQRELSYYICQVYLPTTVLVLVSFISFWFDAGATTARVLIGVMTLLTMATTQAGINSQLPPVAYTKAIDVWTGVCLFFIFASLLEFAAVHYYSRAERRHTNTVVRIDNNEQPLLSDAYGQRKTFGLQIPVARAHKLDFLSRLIFPLGFLVFNILYWSIYLATVRQWPDPY